MKAIRWAVEHDAQVINMSLGSFRDPRDPDRDAFSPLEAQAIGWAHGQGRRDRGRGREQQDTPPRPWPYASYPAACRTCSASARSRGTAPSRLLAPRQDLRRHRRPRRRHPLDVSARAHRRDEGLPEQGYSSCAPDDFRKGRDSFAAPQVSAAAASCSRSGPAAARAGDRAADADGTRRQRRHRLPGLRPPTGRAHRLGPPRRQRGAEAAPQCGTAGARPARAERRRRRRCGCTLGQGEPDRSHARLLGRPERRLRDQVQAAASGSSSASGACRHRHEPDPLAAGTKHVDDLGSLSSSPASRPARPTGASRLPRAEDGHVLPAGEARLARRRQIPARVVKK